MGEDLLQLVRVPLVCMSSSVSTCIRSDLRVCSHLPSCLVELYFCRELCVHLCVREKEKEKDKEKAKDIEYMHVSGDVCTYLAFSSKL